MPWPPRFQESRGPGRACGNAPRRDALCQSSRETIRCRARARGPAPRIASAAVRSETGVRQRRRACTAASRRSRDRAQRSRRRGPTAAAATSGPPRTIPSRRTSTGNTTLMPARFSRRLPRPGRRAGRGNAAPAVCEPVRQLGLRDASKHHEARLFQCRFSGAGKSIPRAERDVDARAAQGRHRVAGVVDTGLSVRVGEGRHGSCRSTCATR